MVVAGHYLATVAGFRILEEGGNAIDAGVAAGLALNVVEPHRCSLGGVAPIILYQSDHRRVVTISGLGRWPRAATIQVFEERCNGEIPVGVMRCITPGAPDAWLTALELYGTSSFAQVAGPALELAERGFPAQESLKAFVVRYKENLSRWPSSREVFMPNGRPPEVGEVFRQPALARTFRRMVEVEKSHSSKGRERALQAVREFFYKGEIAREIAGFVQSQGGLLTAEDMAAFRVKVEPPVKAVYKGYTLYFCGPWCQGPVNGQVLHMLEGLDLKAMGHNTPDYVHTITEAFKLAFADRHYYYGDPDFVPVPIQGLLSQQYAAARRAAINPTTACREMPEPGDPWPFQPGPHPSFPRPRRPEPKAGPKPTDTPTLCTVDRCGTAFSATISDGFSGAPIVPGLGFLCSSRGTQSWLDPDHPSAVAPGKRPRLTPNPALAFKDGRLFLAFGTPGGDAQPQAMVQTFLNIVEWGMTPQQAVEAPRFATFSFPNSFWPHAYEPGLLAVEGRLPAEVVGELARRGHRMEVWEPQTPSVGGVCCIQADPERGVLVGGADPRRDCYALGR